jgi:adenine-specific DNA methylase
VRPIHYLGSKLRLADRIVDAIDSIDGGDGRVCDLFAGSGTVSAALATRRPVTAVDVQEYSRVLCSAILGPAVPSKRLRESVITAAATSDYALKLNWALNPLVEYEQNCIARAEAGDPEDLARFLDACPIVYQSSGSNSTIDSAHSAPFRDAIERLKDVAVGRGGGSVVSRFYGGVYFSFAQAAALDALLAATGRCRGTNRDFFLAAIAGAASDSVNSVGKQFAQPVRLRRRDGSLKPHLIGKISHDRSVSVTEQFEQRLADLVVLARSQFPHRATQTDFAAYLRDADDDLAVVYADPPYTRDHYSRYYHVLETICLGDEPSLTLSNLGDGTAASRGVYRTGRYQSPFCIKRQAPAAFAELFSLARARNVPLLLSYSPFDSDAGAHPRTMTIEGIIALAKRCYRAVEVVSVGPFVHSKLNNADRSLRHSREAELLVVCTL